MHAGIMPARLPDSMPMLSMCGAAASTGAATAATGTADLLSQCTTEWSRYFIASRIATRTKYTAALTADLSPQQQSDPAGYRSPVNFYRTQPQATFNLRNDSASSASSSPLSTSPVESPASVDLLPASPDSPDSRLRKVASCAVTASERSAGKRRVQFADEVGLALTRVKFLSDPCSLAQGCDSQDSSESLAPPGTDNPQSDCGIQLKCRFAQPISKYIVFRETLERSLVCLSFAHLDFATIRGAVAVKNVSFRKRVFARVTFDGWRSHRDVEAAYNGSEGPQDNFAFSVQCPQDQAEDVQFCVCFETDSGAHWDNNGGENYRVQVCRCGDAPSGYTRDFKPNFSSVPEFSEFCAWEHFTDRVYY